MFCYVTPEHTANFHNVRIYTQDDYLVVMSMLMNVYQITDSSYKQYPED